LKLTYTIAHVEDHPMWRKLLGVHLQRAGFSPSHEAANGAELLKMLESGQTVPDVCLLDLNMPGIDGFETATLLREKYPTIKILAYSGNDFPDRVEKALTCGAHGFISKDLSPEEINKALIAVLNGQPCIKQHPVTIKGCGGKAAAYPHLSTEQLQ
jgi:DNA-binding NarL/FixJ family response regulator